MSSITVILLLLGLATSAISEDNFDVRLHLSSVSRYGTIKDIGDNSFASSKIPDQCTPIHLNLLARHGTRAPTKKKMREFDTLSSRLEVLLNDLKDRKKSSVRVPAWLWGWRSPWIGKPTGGELIKQGEDDLYHLGIRVREKFPQLFSEEYHPDIYPIKATQIPRASASAVAFGMGLFSGRGNLGPGYHRAFAVTSESRASDTVLRFHECCQNYKAFRKSQQPAVDKLKEPILDEITQELIRRYGVNFSKQETASLWSLCKQEASLLDITNQACGLFNPSEVLLLEWTDDLELFKLKGYGNSLNYQMGVPLLEDVIQSMEQAVVDNEKSDVLGRHEKARMRFAHAETLLPFSCLLGLFLEGSDFEKIQREQTLELPPKPPQKRFWRGSLAVPFAGNNMLVLYSCPDSNSSKYNSSKYFVQVQHNEHPTPLPGCNGSDFCPFDVFKERIAAPHLKRDYNALCNVKTDEPRQRKPTSTVSKLLSWLLFWENSDSDATNRTEL